MTDPGSYREPIAIEAFTTADDGAGGYTATWDDAPGWELIWASFDPLRGDEQLQAMQTTAHGTHWMRTHYLDGLKSTIHRIRRHRDNAIIEIVAPPTADPMRLEMKALVRETETT